EFHVEFTNDIRGGAWLQNGVLVSSTPNPDGNRDEVWRANEPLSAGAVQFGRVRVVKP
ncbi:MAG: hypothetical protein JWL90_1941, partial [Chthoniobacteraceae bacterium]|nr:hypothetical protein [Chthoniobacteraceae bacterium]